nr:8312_t:CDS:2 [Entrophospora candida]
MLIHSKNFITTQLWISCATNNDNQFRIFEFYRNGNLPQIFSQSQSILLGPLTELSQFTHTGYNILCWYEKEILENLKSYWPNLILQTEYTEESMRLTICGYVSKKLILKPHHNRS